MNNSEIIEKKYAEAVQGIKEEWFTTANSKWYDYIVSLPIHLQVTYLVTVLHNQVFNGGLDQYFVNGYGQFAKETINSLIDIGAFRKAEILKQALEIVNVEHDIDNVFRKRLIEKDIKPFFDGDLFAPLEKLDDEYYESEEEDIEQLLGEYLQNH